MTHGSITIDQDRCKGCGLCVLVCPQRVISLEERVFNAKGFHPARLDEAERECTGCAVCAVICPDVCITVFREALPHRRHDLQGA
jgi:2-oxoglutarate ferredoxin oxidoreductase subunit delta